GNRLEKLCKAEVLASVRGLAAALGNNGQGASSQLLAGALPGDLAAGGHRDGASFDQYNLVDATFGGVTDCILHRSKQSRMMRLIDKFSLRFGDNNQFFATQ